MAKFYEWLYNNQARILVWLLRRSNYGGGGDVDDWTRYQTLGRWAGDRVSLVGDYDESNLYNEAEKYTDISKLLRNEYNKAAKEVGVRKEMGL